MPEVRYEGEPAAEELVDSRSGCKNQVANTAFSTMAYDIWEAGLEIENIIDADPKIILNQRPILAFFKFMLAIRSMACRALSGCQRFKSG